MMANMKVMCGLLLLMPALLPDLTECHARAGLLVAAFQVYPSLREPLREEVISSILPNLPERQAYVLVDTEENSITMVSSLVLQMLQVIWPSMQLLRWQLSMLWWHTWHPWPLVLPAHRAQCGIAGSCAQLRSTATVQVSVQLPSLDREDLTQDYDQACQWIDRFWIACLERCASSCCACSAVTHQYQGSSLPFVPLLSCITHPGLPQIRPSACRLSKAARSAGGHDFKATLDDLVRGE